MLQTIRLLRFDDDEPRFLFRPQFPEESADCGREATAAALEDLKRMTLTVIDGDFPRDVISRENLTFRRFTMTGSKNNPGAYDAKRFGPGQKKGGVLIRTDKLGMIDGNRSVRLRMASLWPAAALAVGCLLFPAIRRRRARRSV